MLKLISCVLLLSLAAGCIIVDDDPYHGYDTDVVIETGHVHSAHCGHYRYGSRWYYSSSHVHGPGCGHHLSGGIWIRAH